MSNISDWWRRTTLSNSSSLPLYNLHLGVSKIISPPILDLIYVSSRKRSSCHFLGFQYWSYNSSGVHKQSEVRLSKKVEKIRCSYLEKSGMHAPLLWATNIHCQFTKSGLGASLLVRAHLQGYSNTSRILCGYIFLLYVRNLPERVV